MLPKLRCRNSFEQHLEYFARRSEAMRDYEEWLEGVIRQA